MNGTPVIVPGRAGALANYPHARRAGGLIFVSGVSSRRFDNTYDGVTLLPDGTVELDIRAQTRAVIENIRAILQAAGADLEHVVDATVFLVDMKDYAGMNEVYNEYFNAAAGPSRTTIGVRQLPGEHLLIEIKVVAIDPGRS
jgi:2-aminomuconate deaminase